MTISLDVCCCKALCTKRPGFRPYINEKNMHLNGKKKKIKRLRYLSGTYTGRNYHYYDPQRIIKTPDGMRNENWHCFIYVD